MYSFIVNPNASGGRGERIWRRLEKQLKHLGVPYEAFVTEKTGDARRLACDLTEHQREPRILIAVGGDGTVSEVLDGISELKKNRGDNFSIKQLERTKKTVKQKLDKLNDQSRKDDVVTFEELGVDRIFIDEAHYYKNLAAFTKMRNVGGISQTEAIPMPRMQTPAPCKIPAAWYNSCRAAATPCHFAR